MRIYALFILVAALAIYAWRDWFKSLCGLILLMAVIEHEDMPKSIMGVQGLNSWNILFVTVFLAWLISRRREGLKWDMPQHINVLLILYLLVIIIGVIRAALDRSHIENYPLKSLISEEFFNTIKWTIPGVLLFDGCRTRKRLLLAIVCILGMYFFIALQVVRRVPWSWALAGGGKAMERARIRHCSRIGYSACDISTFLAGAFWAMLAALILVRQKRYKILLLGAAGIVAFGQALTGGRAGYAAWVLTGLILGLFKWRKYLILIPAAIIIIYFAFPGVFQRVLTGFGEKDVTGQEVINQYELTSGRAQIWPYVIDKIEESPVVGYGRLAMRRTGLTEYLGAKFGRSEAFPHPHNLYLETMLDNGILGALPIFIFFIVVISYSARLFRDANPWFSAIGGLSLSMVLAQLIGGIGSQHYYPRESTLGMWASIFLMFRVSIEYSRLLHVSRMHAYVHNSSAISSRMAVSSLTVER